MYTDKRLAVKTQRKAAKLIQSGAETKINIKPAVSLS